MLKIKTLLLLAFSAFASVDLIGSSYLGVCHMGGLRGGSIADEISTINSIADAGARRVRLNIETIDPGDLELLGARLNAARRRDLKVLLVVPLAIAIDTSSEPDATRRKGIPSRRIWHAPKASAIDINLFKQRINKLAAWLEDNDLRIDEIELFNEPNSGSFNGDFPLNGKTYYAADLEEKHEPEILIREGIARMAKCHHILKQERDKSGALASTRIITAGLVTSKGITKERQLGADNPSRPAGMPAADFLRIYNEYGVLNQVDGIGVHFYPFVPEGKRDSLEQSASTLRAYILKRTNPIVEVVGKGTPIHITEWGFRYENPDAYSDEQRQRRVLVFAFLRALRTSDVSFDSAYFFSFSRNEDHALVIDGRKLPAADFLTGAEYFRPER
jgi:hypothetical protein